MFDNIFPGNQFLIRDSCKRIDPRQIEYINRIIPVEKFSFALFNRLTGPVSYMLMKPCKKVKYCGFPRIALSCKDYIDFLFTIHLTSTMIFDASPQPITSFDPATST